MSSSIRSGRSWMLPFFVIWGGELVSLIGSALAQFALVWWLTSTTGSAVVLATASLVAMLPGIILGPFAGAYVDRLDRRKVMIVADAVSALAAAGLGLLFWADAIQIWHVYVVMFVRSLAGSFQWPAMQASTALMVPQAQLSRVAGLNQMAHGSLGIVAPPLGALLLALLPIHTLMALDFVTAAPAIIALCLVTIPRLQREDLAGGEAPRPSLWSDLQAGVRYVWGWPGLMLLIAQAMLLNFLTQPAFSLLPLLVTRELGGGALQLAWMNSATGAGFVLGGLLLAAWGGFRRRIATTLLGIAVMGIAVLLLAAIPAGTLWLAVAAMALVGLTQPMINGPVHAVIQAVVAPEMHGRVFTLIGSLASIMAPLGLLIGGPVVDLGGIRAWYLLTGATCLVMGAGAWFVPAIRYLEDRDGYAPPDVGDAEAVVPDGTRLGELESLGG